MLSTAEPLHAPDSKDIFFHKFNFIERYDYSMISKHLMLQFITPYSGSVVKTQI